MWKLKIISFLFYASLCFTYSPFKYARYFPALRSLCLLFSAWNSSQRYVFHFILYLFWIFDQVSTWLTSLCNIATPSSLPCFSSITWSSRTLVLSHIILHPHLYRWRKWELSSVSSPQEIRTLGPVNMPLPKTFRGHFFKSCLQRKKSCHLKKQCFSKCVPPNTWIRNTLEGDNWELIKKTVSWPYHRSIKSEFLTMGLRNLPFE